MVSVDGVAVTVIVVAAVAAFASAAIAVVIVIVDVVVGCCWLVLELEAVIIIGECIILNQFSRGDFLFVGRRVGLGWLVMLRRCTVQIPRDFTLPTIVVVVVVVVAIVVVVVAIVIVAVVAIV